MSNSTFFSTSPFESKVICALMKLGLGLQVAINPDPNLIVPLIVSVKNSADFKNAVEKSDGGIFVNEIKVSEETAIVTARIKVSLFEKLLNVSNVISFECSTTSLLSKNGFTKRK